MLLATGRAALEVSAESRNRGVGVEAGQLELDELVEPVEALIASDLLLARPEQPF